MGQILHSKRIKITQVSPAVAPGGGVLWLNIDKRIISIKAESPKLNVKIVQRLALCHRSFFLAGYGAQQVRLQ